MTRFGAFEFNLKTGELCKGGIRIKLPAQSAEILTVLLERPANLVTREELHQKLWPADTFVDFDHGLNNAINRLREALSDSADAPRFIETLPRRGYRFIAEVNRDTSAASRATVLTDSTETEEVSSAAGSERAAAAKASPVPSLRRVGKFWLVAAGMGIAAAVILGLYFGRERTFGTKAAVRIQSIAVLPLDNLSGDPAQEYFADGITDALTTQLAQFGSLRVISRTSAMQYKGARKRLPQITRELNVDAVVQGSAVRTGNRVRLTVQLIQGATDAHLWAQDYEYDVRDVFAVQSEIARAIADRIQVRLTPQEKARLAAVRRVDSAAYEAFLQGRFHTLRVNRDDNQLAISLFERAVALDPAFARAYAELASAYATKQSFFAPLDKQWEEKAYVAIEKAVAIDPGLAEAHFARGFLLWRPSNHFPHEKAIQEYHRALAVNPNLDEAHHYLGVIYLHIGLFDKAMEEVQKALAINPSNTLARYRVGVILHHQGKYDDALAVLQTIPKEFNPALVGRQVAWTLFSLGRTEEASAVIADWLRQYPKDEGGQFASVQAMILAAAGKKRQAEEKIRSAAEQRKGFVHFHHTAYNIGVAYALMGQPETAVRWFEDAAQDGYPCYPMYESLRGLVQLGPNAHFNHFLADQNRQWEHYKTTL